MEKVKIKKNSFEIMLNVFAWLSFFLAVVLSLMVLFSTFSGTENGKAVFGYKMLIVESDSMSKSQISENEKIFFSSGDLILIKEVEDFSTVKEGDVITFVSYGSESNGKTLSHKVRSVRVSASGALVGFETYGINTGISDEVIVEPDAVIGRYVAKIENLGTLFKFFKTPAGYFTSILVPCLLLIIFFSIEVGKLLGRKQIADTYDVEIENLKGRLTQLENTEDGVVTEMNEENSAVNNINTSGVDTAPAQQETANNTACTCGAPEHTVNQAAYQPFPPPPPYQQSACSERALELTVNALNSTIQTLTRTIEALAATVEKPVDTLSRTIETLANAASKPTVIEKTVVQPAVQPVAQSTVVAVTEQPTPMDTTETIATAEAAVPVEFVTSEEDATPETVEETGVSSSPLDALGQPRERVPFNKKLLSLDSEIKNYFSEIHNQLISYKKVSYRVSFRGIAYRIGRKTLAKMMVRGKTLKLHLALNVDDYPRTVFFQENSGDVKMYEDVPFTVKIKSNRGKNNALRLITHLAEDNGLVQKQEFKNENVLKQLKSLK